MASALVLSDARTLTGRRRRRRIARRDIIVGARLHDRVADTLKTVIVRVLNCVLHLLGMLHLPLHLLLHLMLWVAPQMWRVISATLKHPVAIIFIFSSPYAICSCSSRRCHCNGGRSDHGIAACGSSTRASVGTSSSFSCSYGYRVV